MNQKQTTWNLGLLYKNENDPQIEKDLLLIEKSCTAFEKKYKNKDFTASASKLLTALKDREELRMKMSGSKPWWYMALRADINSKDEKANSFATKFSQRITNATNKTAFFSLTVGKIPLSKQLAYLKETSLMDFRYSLQRNFNSAKYNLSEGEEQVVDLLSQTSYSMWVDGFNKVLSQQMIVHKGKSIPLSKALGILMDLPLKERRVLSKKINEKLIENSDFPEAEINAVYNYKKILDIRRGFKHPYSSTVLGHENDEKTVMNLVNLVTKNFKISHRFFKLHSKLLKEKKLKMEDRAVKIGEIKRKFDFPSSVVLVRNAFSKIDPKFANMLSEFVNNRQIDVYPRKGKKGGGYCWGRAKHPTFILLNHNDDIRSLETLAHEMGHAIHTELSKSQPPRYSHYSTATAEVASTFFANVAVAEVEKQLSINENIILLHNKILGDISTIFRQIACFNFELELHNTIRERGELPKAGIASLMTKHLKSYVGDAMEVTSDDGYAFVYWSHIRRFFYVYTYAYGQLISRALFEKWQQDKSYSKKIEQFLSAGRSMSPTDIFRSIGIDITNPEFFEIGLKSIEKDISKLEKLAKKAGMI